MLSDTIFISFPFLLPTAIDTSKDTIEYVFPDLVPPRLAIVLTPER